MELWNGQHKRHIEAINQASRATARQSVLLEIFFAGFGDSSDKVEKSINRYLAFPELDPEFLENRTKISDKTAKEFWRLYKGDAMPNYVKLAFAKNKELMMLLESFKS